MVAGGVGLAPFATLAEALRAAQVPATLFYGGRSSGDLVYVDWFRRLGVRVRLTTEDGSRGESGLVTGALERTLAAAPVPPPMIYACGPTPMMRAVAALAREHGCPAEVSLEPVMGCGLGGCYSCVVRVPRRAVGRRWASRAIVSARPRVPRRSDRVGCPRGGGLKPRGPCPRSTWRFRADPSG